MQINEDILKCVVFLGTKGKKNDEPFRPRATGFIVDYNYRGFSFIHLVTADHVVAQLLGTGFDIYCRANMIGGGVKEVRLAGDCWKSYPDERSKTDVAVCPFNPHGSGFDYRSLPIFGDMSIAATSDVLNANHMGLGDETFIVGLFRSHFGKERNVPIVRIGNLSAMRDEPVKAGDYGYIDAYLVEARSIGGLSGSPVFVNRPPFQILQNGSIVQTTGLRHLLLGLVHGHFDVSDLKNDTVVEDDGERKTSINTGVGVVIPIEKIIETIEHPDLVELRAAAMAEHDKNNPSPTPDLDFDDEKPAHSVDSNNPTHKEDFTSLLGAAARKKPQGD